MFKRVIIFDYQKKEIEPLVKRAGFEIVESLKDNPDFAITYGGDGTIMRAEFEYSQIPKLALRGSRIGKKCVPLPPQEALTKVKNGNYKIDEIMKLQVSFGDEALNALDSVLVHNADPRHAIRYHAFLNGKNIGDEIIGDGVVIATPFGSTGYYRSITDSYFEVGIGLAFNNSTEQADHIVLREDAEIEIKIIRGPAEVYADNQKDFINLQDGNSVVIRRSSQTAKLIHFS